MELKEIAAMLHPLERQLIPYLNKTDSYEELVKLSNLKDIEVMRALQWLENKGIVQLTKQIEEMIDLDTYGDDYKKNGLPEKRLLKAIIKSSKTQEQISKESKLNMQEIGVSMGVLKSKMAIELTNDKTLKITITENGKRMAETESLEEKFLSLTFPINIKDLKDEEKYALEQLKKRKTVIKNITKKIISYNLTETGKRLVKLDITSNYSEKLTATMLKDGSWKGKEFRKYDVSINVPKIYGGRKQHYRKFQDEIRKKFVSLGFSEMNGPLVETEFWNMDALFMPQFHSARDIHDAYYVKEPKYGKLNEDVVKKVKDAHEKGILGSKGWQYEFDEKRTHRHLLRSQGTACSARMLASPDLKIPGKYFAITRCFRYDVIDATHNCDFFQTEGIVIEEGLNFKHLKGLLKMFAKEFANTDKIKITPGYFPFTEPSVEIHAKHPDLGWIELGGSGIFRPELVKPLVGKDVSVIAWGLGIDRIGMFKLGIKDIRNLFSHDLKFLRETKQI